MHLSRGKVMFYLAIASVLSGLPISAQNFISGPEIVGISVARGARITVELDSPAMLEIRHWAADEVQESNKKLNIQSKDHEFFIPLDKERKYLVVLLDDSGKEIKRSSLFSTKAAIQIPRDIARITISEAEVVNGNQLRIKVDALNVPSITVSWRSPERGDESITKSLNNGPQEFTVELPVPPPDQNTLLIPVTIIAQNGETMKKTVATEKPPVTTPPVIGDIDVKKSYRSATFTVPMVTKSPIVHYKLALSDSASFRLDKQDTCPASSACIIKIDGLEPGKKYTYTFDAATSQAGPYASAFNASGRTFSVETESLPKIVAGPQVVFTATGLNLAVTTDKPVDSVLTFPIADQAQGATEQRKFVTTHSYNLNQSLVFARKDGIIKADLMLILKEPDGAEIQRLPLIIGGQFADITSSQQEQSKLRGQKLESAVKNYGPAVKALLGLVF